MRRENELQVLTWEYLEQKVKEAFEDGKREGIAMTLNGRPFDRKRVAAYMMINSGCKIEDVAQAINESDTGTASIYLEVLEYYEKILITNEQRAMQRLLAAIQSGEELDDLD